MNKKDWHAACGIQLWLRRNMSVVCRARKISTQPSDVLSRRVSIAMRTTAGALHEGVRGG